MNYTLCFRAEVEDDAVAAYMWYEQKGQGLGEEFLPTFYVGAQNYWENSCCTQLCIGASMATVKAASRI